MRMGKMIGLVVLFVVLSVAGSDGGPVFAEESLRITSGEWPPYYSETMKSGGLDGYIVSEVFKNAGVTVSYGYFPWKRSYMMSKSGQWDGTIGWSDVPERREEHLYSARPISYPKFVFFHLNGTPFEWNDYKDLRKYHIGITLGYDYGREFHEALDAGRLNIHKAPSDEHNFRLLKNGAIDIFPCDVEVGLFMIRRLFDPADREVFAHHPKAVDESPLYLLLSKKHARGEDLMRRFNAAFEAYLMSGEYEKAIKAYRSAHYAASLSVAE